MRSKRELSAGEKAAAAGRGLPSPPPQQENRLAEAPGLARCSRGRDSMNVDQRGFAVLNRGIAERSRRLHQKPDFLLCWDLLTPESCVRQRLSLCDENSSGVVGF